MSNIGLPQIVINFKALANTAMARSEKGYVGIILTDTSTTKTKTLKSVTDIPVDLSADSKTYIERAFLGKPKQITIYILSTDSTDYEDALSYFETVKIDYLVGSPTITTTQATSLVTWVKRCRDELGVKVKVIVPKTVADYEGVINFDTDDIKVNSDTYTAEQYCSRIAGILAGISSSQSATLYTLNEVEDVPHLTKIQADTLIGAGKLILYYDFDEVKIGRGVNSLTTITDSKSDAFKKIKIVDIIDLIETDIKNNIKKNYIGKVANSYDNKCVLITAISEYYKNLERDSLLVVGTSMISVDTSENELYLKSVGIDTSKMSEAEIKMADTGDKVFLISTIKPIDSIEDVKINITI